MTGAGGASPAILWRGFPCEQVHCPDVHSLEAVDAMTKLKEMKEPFTQDSTSMERPPVLFILALLKEESS